MIIWGTIVLATQVAVTVDDLPLHGNDSVHFPRKEFFSKMLSAFKKHHLPPVYGFLNGIGTKQDREGIKLLKKWTKAKQLLGNHTYSHANLTEISQDKIVQELQLNDVILQKLSPKQDFHFFRFPYIKEGDTLEKRNEIRTLLKAKNYKIAEVTIYFWDTNWNDPFLRCVEKNNISKIQELKESYIDFAIHKLEMAKKMSFLLFGREIPQILLFHMGAMNAYAADALLTAYEKAGVQFVSLTDAAQDPAYALDPQFVSNEGATFLDQFMKAQNRPYPEDLNPYPPSDIEHACLETQP